MSTILYSEIKRDVLSLIRQYTVAGRQIPDTYNSQADYLNQIPQLINMALVNIRTLTKPLSVIYPLSEGTDHGDFVWYELPEDMWKLKSGGVFRENNGKLESTNKYRLLGDRTLLVPKRLDGGYLVEYYRYPNQLNRDARDTDELSEELDVIQAAEFYAAAMLVMQDDAFAYANLFNEYESRLSRMSQGPVANVHPVEDVYTFDYDGGYSV